MPPAVSSGLREVLIAKREREVGRGAVLGSVLGPHPFPMMVRDFQRVVGIEARGFILGGAVAHELGRGFVPIRKKGKLPWKVIGREYQLEYGVDRVEIHADAIKPGDKVLLIDDLIATGGTAEAAASLIRDSGGEIISAAFVVDLPDLGGCDKLINAGIKVHKLVEFEGD